MGKVKVSDLKERIKTINPNYPDKEINEIFTLWYQLKKFESDKTTKMDKIDKVKDNKEISA